MGGGPPWRDGSGWGTHGGSKVGGHRGVAMGRWVSGRGSCRAVHGGWMVGAILGLTMGWGHHGRCMAGGALGGCPS